MSSKGQLEINETILVLIVISILAIAGLVFFHRYQTASISSIILDNGRLELYELLNQLPNMPELQCSTQGLQDECLDLYKMISFSKIQSSYFSLLGYKTITIKLIYPELPDKACSDSSFQLATFPNCNSILIYDRKPVNIKATEIVSSPVAVFNPLNNEYLLGIMEIKWHY